MCQETVDNERILDSDNSQKHKIVYIAGHMVHKYGNISETKMNQIYQNFWMYLIEEDLAILCCQQLSFYIAHFWYFKKSSKLVAVVAIT